MPKLIDRQANAALVHPLVMRILAEEGPGAVSYRRVAVETGLTLSTVRNMWQTQAKLVQRGGARAFSLVQMPMFLPGRHHDPSAVLREGIRRLLPLGADQRVAHRALTALRQAPAGSPARGVATEYDDTRRRRVVELIDEVAWLRLPEPRPDRSTSVEQIRARQTAEPEGGGLLVHALLVGLADLLASPGSVLTRDHVEACLRRVEVTLLD